MDMWVEVKEGAMKQCTSVDTEKEFNASDGRRHICYACNTCNRYDTLSDAEEGMATTGFTRPGWINACSA